MWHQWIRYFLVGGIRYFNNCDPSQVIVSISPNESLNVIKYDLDRNGDFSNDPYFNHGTNHAVLFNDSINSTQTISVQDLAGNEGSVTVDHLEEANLRFEIVRKLPTFSPHYNHKPSYSFILSMENVIPLADLAPDGGFRIYYSNSGGSNCFADPLALRTSSQY